MKRKNADKGLSIVELVVVIAIMTIVAAGGLSLTGMIPRRQVLGCANELVYSMDKTRTNAMSFKSSELWIHMEADGLYATIVTNQSAADTDGAVLTEATIYNEECIGRTDMQVSYLVSGATEKTDLGTDTLVIRYDRTNGGFIQSYVITEGATTGTAISEGDANHTVSNIYITKGRFTRILNLVRLTGKVTAEWAP